MASFGFANEAHVFSWVAQKIVSESKVVATVSSKVQGQEQLVEGVTSMISPQAVLIERVAFGLFGKASKAVNDAGGAADAKGLSLALDEEEFTELQSIASYVKSHPLAQGAGLAAKTEQPT
jgi:hypothetical protein